MSGAKRTTGWYYLLALLVPFVGCAASFASGYTSLKARVAEMQRVVVPGETSLELKPGDYTGYYESASVVDGKIFATGPLSGMHCQLVDSSGGEVSVGKGSTHSSYAIGAYAGESIFEFKAEGPGTYRLACVYDEGRTQAPVVLAIGYGPMVNWMGAILPALGGLLVGLVLFIVVFFKRRRSS